MTDRVYLVRLPWPPAQLSPNFRTRRMSWVSKIRRDYRKACFDAAWDLGIRPTGEGALRKVTFHPPNKRARDDDNAIAAFKGGRDGLAEALGVDDGTFNGVVPQLGTPIKGGAVVATIEFPA